ncbi:MAG: glycoside hydrolase family 9 protein [Bryobacteraceae bacterium]
MQVDGNFSGKPDDRWAFTTKSGFLQYNAAASLAAAARVLKGWDDPLAKECLDTAVKLWDEEHAHPTASQGPGGFGSGSMGGGMDWNAALELLIATDGAEPYRKRVLELLPTIKQRFGFNGWGHAAV